MIETERLLLRRWREDDAPRLTALRADPAVSRLLGAPPSMDESRATIARQNELLDTLGYCFWAVELRATGAFIGWCGLKPGPADSPAAGEIEIGWTLAPSCWRRGLAREAAGSVLAWAWAHTGHSRVFAITTPSNRASWGLMQRLGMTRLADADFDHPKLAEGDPLRRHLTYAIGRPG